MGPAAANFGNRIFYTGAGIIAALLLLLWVWKPWKKESSEKDKEKSGIMRPAENPAEQAYQTAINAGTLRALRDFRAQYPGSAKDAAAQSAIRQLEGRRNQLINTADAFMAEGLYADALTKLQAAEIISPDDPEVLKRLAKIAARKKGRD